MAQRIDFVKMEGAANDYVYIDARRAEAPAFSAAEIALLSDRRRGIGGDGLVLILPSSKGLARMRMFNADGSASAMCGNALRCIAFYAGREQNQAEFLVESDLGLHRARILSAGDNDPGLAAVEIAAPRFGAEQIPFLAHGAVQVESIGGLLRAQLAVEGKVWALHLVSMGNPHGVIFVDDPDALDLSQIGPALERHPAFPERCNIELVRESGDGRFEQRTWERGSGETLACGSGACAVHVVAHLLGKSDASSRIRLRGGELQVDWDKERADAAAILSGPARIVFSGSFDLDEFRSRAAESVK